MKCPKCHFENPDDTLYCGKCATPLKPSGEISVTKTMETPREEITTGSIFAGRYEILEELGKGGMGEVYKVRDKKLDEEMAIKVLKPDIAANKGIIERFKNELKLARKIGHRNVCRMYDLNEEEETPYITMEYVEGDNLKTHIRKKEKLTQEEAISLAKQVCEGLTEAHRFGIVHRDLKPSNIMIDKEGNTKIMDFGIARSLEAPGVTKAGVMIGTPDYISPEQAEGEEADQRSDIYSLGVILYEMVTGKIPFKGDTALSVALKHKAQLPQDPRKLNPDISDNLSRLILICMEKDRERRYQTAEELLSDLRNIEEGLPLGTKLQPRRKTFMATLIRKKLFIPAVVAALAIIAVVIWQILPQKGVVPSEPAKPSIAVLPFKDLSPEKDQEYFCDGLAETLISTLTNIKDLKVPARTSAFLFKGKEIDIREIGEKLNVDKILEGSVQIEGKRLRITAQLINVEDGYHLWSEKYDRDRQDIFSIQDEISLSIVDKLKVKLLGEEKERLVKRHTESHEAYNLYLEGKYYFDRFDLQKAMMSFRQALEKDPSYALAYVGIAQCYARLGNFAFLPRKETFPKAKAAVEKALEIDSTLGEAHCWLADIKMSFDWDWEGAEREFKRAIELNPGYALAHSTYANYLSTMGRFDEAIIELKQAQEIDPLSLFIKWLGGGIFYFACQYDESIEQFHKALEMDPNYIMAHIFLGQTYIAKGMYEEAIAACQKAVTLSEGSPLDTIALGWLGWAYAYSGQRDEPLKILDRLDELSRKKHVSPVYIAMIYVGLGDKDQAFKYLEKAYLDRSFYLIYLKIQPICDPLRSDPRFKALLKKMNLE